MLTFWRFHIGERMRLAMALLLLIAQPVPVAARTHRNLRDFSTKGTEYRVLEDLRLAADDVTYSGTDRIEIFGNSYMASKYSLQTTVEVQTMCSLGVDGSSGLQSYERLPAEFEVYVVEDTDRVLHDELVDGAYSIWRRGEIFSGEYFYDFSVHDGHYALSALPDLVSVKGFFFVWINGRVVKFVFKNFRDKQKSGWGVMDSLNEENLRVRVGNTEIMAYQPTGGVRQDFLKLYRTGYFRLAKAGARRPSTIH